MRTYLVEERGVPADAVIEEDRSTTTMENLRNSKAIMDARSGAGAYRAAVVTSDYHVFRTAEYAHKIGLPPTAWAAGRRVLLAHRVHPRIRGRQQRPPLAVRGHLRVLAPFRRHRAVPAVTRFAPAPTSHA